MSGYITHLPFFRRKNRRHISYPKLSAWHFIVYANPVIYATPQIRFEVNFKWKNKKEGVIIYAILWFFLIEKQKYIYV
jgi:hypothetical protein